MSLLYSAGRQAIVVRVILLMSCLMFHREKRQSQIHMQMTKTKTRSVRKTSKMITTPKRSKVVRTMAITTRKLTTTAKKITNQKTHAC